MNVRRTQVFLFVLFAAAPAALSQRATDCGTSAISIVPLNHYPGPQSDSSEAGPPYWGQALQISAARQSNLKQLVWRFDGPAIHDFDERVSSAEFTARGWQVQVAASPLRNQSTFRLYFVPLRSASKQSPSRTITLNAVIGTSNTPCQTTRTMVFKPHPRPAELYTSDHRDPFQTNPHQGRVIDSHFQWHFFHALNRGDLLAHPSFFHWHHLFVDRYQRWRYLFGYPQLTPMWPQPASRFLTANLRYWLFTKDSLLTASPNTNVPVQTTTNYSSANAAEFARFENETVMRHNQVHNSIQQCSGRFMPFGCFLSTSSPKTELFWSFHLFLDNLYKTLCPPSGSRPRGCPDTGYR